MKLFRKDIEKRCEYCIHAGTVSADTCICARCGIVSAEDSCRKFRYDPLRRVPERPEVPDFSRFEAKDYSL